MKHHLFSLVFLSSLLCMVMPGWAVIPSDKHDVEDEIQVNQENKDRKIWSNLLAVVDNARKIAQGSLEIMQRVSDYAWSAAKFLNAVEQTATEAVVVYKNIEGLQQFFTSDPTNLNKPFFEQLADITGRMVDIVEYTQEDIFNQTENLRLNTVPSMFESRDNMIRAGINLYNAPGDYVRNIQNNLKEFQGYEKKYTNLATIGSADSRVYDSIKTNPAVKRHVVSQGAAIDAMASADVRNLELDNEGVAAKVIISKASDNGKLNTVDMVKDGLLLERNNYVMNLRENDLYHDQIRVTSHMVLARVAMIDRRIAEKSAYLGTTRNYSRVIDSIQLVMEQNR